MTKIPITAKINLTASNRLVQWKKGWYLVGNFTEDEQEMTLGKQGKESNRKNNDLTSCSIMILSAERYFSLKLSLKLLDATITRDNRDQTVKFDKKFWYWSNIVKMMWNPICNITGLFQRIRYRMEFFLIANHFSFLKFIYILCLPKSLVLFEII